MAGSWRAHGGRMAAHGWRPTGTTAAVTSTGLSAASKAAWERQMTRQPRYDRGNEAACLCVLGVAVP
eukprot:6947262-Lingulodinium_polyedra.AAC.1